MDLTFGDLVTKYLNEELRTAADSMGKPRVGVALCPRWSRGGHGCILWQNQEYRVLIGSI